MTREECRTGPEAAGTAVRWFSEAASHVNGPTECIRPLALRRLGEAIRDLNLEVVPRVLLNLFRASSELLALYEAETPNLPDIHRQGGEVDLQLRRLLSKFDLRGCVRRVHGFFDELEGGSTLEALRASWRLSRPSWRADLLDGLRHQVNPFLYSSTPEKFEDTRHQKTQVPLLFVFGTNPASTLRAAFLKRIVDAPDCIQRIRNLHATAFALPALPDSKLLHDKALFEYERKLQLDARKTLSDLPQALVAHAVQDLPKNMLLISK